MVMVKRQKNVNTSALTESMLIFNSVSMLWLGAFKSEMMISNPIQCDLLTQPFIVKDSNFRSTPGYQLSMVSYKKTR